MTVVITRAIPCKPFEKRKGGTKLEGKKHVDQNRLEGIKF